MRKKTDAAVSPRAISLKERMSVLNVYARNRTDLFHEHESVIVSVTGQVNFAVVGSRADRIVTDERLRQVWIH